MASSTNVIALIRNSRLVNLSCLFSGSSPSIRSVLLPGGLATISPKHGGLDGGNSKNPFSSDLREVLLLLIPVSSNDFVQR